MTNPADALAAVELVRAQHRALAALAEGDPYPAADLADEIAVIATSPSQAVETVMALSSLVVSVLHACMPDHASRENLLDQWALHLMTTP